MKKKIAFFDFDGTITTKDTLLEFLKFAKGTFRFYLGFLLSTPYLVAMKLGLFPNQKAKEKVLTFFFKGMTVTQFKRYCVDFSKQELPALIRPKAITEIKELQAKGFEVVLVSASPENWICHWAEEMKLQLLASKLEVVDGKVTGKLIGKNCYGEEKVSRICEFYTLSEYDDIFAYGDTKGDHAMLQLASKKNYKPFRN